MSERVDAAERMLDLVIALAHTRHRMTKAEIRAKVRGYDPEGSTEAFERKFERDKEHLRQLGIPIVTLTDAVHEDEVGYRIDTATYSLPPIDLSPAQMGVLSLAAEVWQDSTFSSAARRGLTKLKAVSDAAAATGTGVTLRVRGPEPAMDELLSAIAERTPVRFRYRAAYNGEIAVREVEPWRIYARDRGWYLVGHDRDRGAQRSFRTSRIIGKVQKVGESGSITIPEQRVPTPERVFRVPVQLAVRPEGAAALRARGTVVESRETADGVRDVIVLEVSDVELLADEIAGYADTVVALEPPELRAAVLRRLRAVAALGGEGLMAETAPDRLARMLAMVAYLRDRPAVLVDEVAEHFGITPKQVLADVNTLWVSGTPGYMHGDLIDFAGDDLEHGVLTLLDSREMDRPLRLSPGEAVALLVALQSLAATLGPGSEDADLVDETIAVLRAAAGEAAAAADAVQIGGRAGAADDRVRQIREALADRRRLHLRYVSASDQTTERDVDPLQLLTDSQRWFLVAWCHEAQDVRQFRVDRILSLEVLDVAADDHHDVELTGRTEPDTAHADQVRFEVTSRTRWLAEQLPGAHIEDLEDGWIAITVGVLDLAWLGNVVLALGDDVRAVEPSEIAEHLQDRANAGLAAYAAVPPT